MKEQTRPTAETAPEEDLVQYLTEHPDFFERHPRLLEKLHLPHATGGAAVSLVERQVAVLQDKNRGLERRLKELVDVARSNTHLSEKVHALAIRLLRARGTEGVLAALEAGLREDFGAHQTVVILLHNTSEIVQQPATRFMRYVDRSDPTLKAFATFIENGRPRCGRVRDVQREFLFTGDSAGIASVAMVPLGPSCEIGILAIGSNDATRFNPTMSTDFLGRIGELASAALAASREPAG
ncbi:MAG: DUF484 family protein [Gammaproteobacteria bacterium]